MNDWQIVNSALNMASVMGVLSLCTCDEPTTVWRGDVCGHCQLAAAKDALQQLQERESSLVSLLRDTLDCVDADEQARRESWPQEVESGELVLDVGDRVRAALRELDVDR